MGLGFSFLDADESVILNYPIGKSVKHGPQVAVYCCATGTLTRKTTLTDTQYLVVTHHVPDRNASVVEVIEGPCLYEIQNGYDSVGNARDKIRLTRDQFIRVVDEASGDKKIIEGPALYTPGAYERCSEVSPKYNLTSTQYIVILDQQNGEKTVRRGPDLYTPGAYEECSSVQDMAVLNDNNYIYVTHMNTGVIDIVEGPTTFCPGPFDKVSPILNKVVLSISEYIKIVDNNTGIIRVERGPATIVLKQYEKLIGQKERAIEVNDHQAVYIFNIDSGQYDLITEHGMFIPSPTQDVIERRTKVRLEPHEVVVIVDKTGQYAVMRGSDDTRTFFVPPYCRLLVQYWSDNLEKDHKNTKKVDKFDLRPQYMDFEFLIRTRDNVEIILDLNFYWQILDVEKMVSTTQDAPEDICKHAMSQILSESSRKDMKEFMESFNEIVQGAVSKDDSFFKERGVTIHKVEITGRRCKDGQTEQIFHEIIKEKTNRIKNLEKKDGENEIRMRELEGQIKAEELNGKLVGVKRGYLRNEAQADGEADAARITNFIENLPEATSLAEKLAIFYDQQNTARVQYITSQPGTTLYVTPQDLDFKITNMNIVNQEGKPGKKRIVP